jgi:DNA repair exonuclease SbcCD nuclease subunit
MSIRFIHTADWQLGKNFDRVTEPDKQARLRQERITAIARIGDVAREREAQFILVAGDLFDSPTATKETVAEALSAIGKLGIPVIAIPGNHDHGGPAGLWEQEFFRSQQPQLAPNFTILLAPAPHEVASAWVLPCPLLRRSESTDTTAWIREPGALDPCNDDKPRILLAHGSTQAFGSRDSYDDEEGDSSATNLINLDRLPAGAVDYVALGDWHGTKEIKPWAWYSGTPEHDRFNKGGDHDPGNILLVDVARGSAPRVENIKIPGIGWHSLSFDFSADTSLEILQQRVSDLIETRSGQDLLQLDLAGSLGLDAAAKLAAYLEDLKARLLRLKLRDHSTVAPTEEEIAGLTTQSNDPLIKRVAARLVDESRGNDETAATARVALRELYTATRSN